ncbi:hypothetical protein [Nonomuraea roseoviolacea]|uniref:Plasmid maintenance system antidote protein VapI n=1 Tax=Nonomuraea roseoviolacea subsp. carminata TaxID=160689 RepID=A0ABT1K9Q6_9ACTN|nr:hypothetical protein [Nonomuraea roseoviolacea]MCP2350680.1 plasmid maintenance system antidote protein VapI [Nonomuraea roseoviolacea subsp. carminata]
MLYEVISALSSLLVGKMAGQLGAWLRQELTRRGYDLAKGGQSQFAREADVHVSIINRVVNKGQGVEIDVLRRIGRALGFNVGEMLVLAGQVERDELPVRPPEELEEASHPEPAPDTNPYSDPYERQVWEMEELSEFVRRSMIVAMQSAIRMEEEEDKRPNADVRQFRRPS